MALRPYAVIVLLLVSLAPGRAWAQVPPPGTVGSLTGGVVSQLGAAPPGIVFAPDAAWRVTVHRKGAQLASFTIPKGTLMVATSLPVSLSSESYSLGGPAELHGEWELRAAPLTDVAPSNGGATITRQELGPIVQTILRRAPFILTTESVDIAVERIVP